MNKRDYQIADYLSKEGHAFSTVLYDENHDFFTTLPNTYFSIATAIALCWTGHAKFEVDFLEYAAAFIEGTIAKDPSIAVHFSERFGVDELDNALKGYRAYYRRIRHLIPDFNLCSIQDINLLQTRLLNHLNNFRETGEVSGIGPWLFLGPFKIILGDQQRLWGNNGLNAVVLPTGIEINRGIRRLKSEGYTFMNDFDLYWIEKKSGSLLDNQAVCNIVHAHIVKIAELAKTNALHINSALYQYGRQEI